MLDFVWHTLYKPHQFNKIWNCSKRSGRAHKRHTQINYTINKHMIKKDTHDIFVSTLQIVLTCYYFFPILGVTQTPFYIYFTCLLYFNFWPFNTFENGVFNKRNNIIINYYLIVCGCVTFLLLKCNTYLVRLNINLFFSFSYLCKKVKFWQIVKWTI